MCFCRLVSSHELLIWSYKLTVTCWQVFCCAVFFAGGRPTLFKLHNPSRRFGTGICVYVGRAWGTFFKEGSKTTTCCAERNFPPCFEFDRKPSWDKKKTKQIKAIHKCIHGVEKLYAFGLKCAFWILPGKTRVMMDNLKIFAGIKVKGSLHSPGLELAYWLDIVRFLDSSLAEGQREALSWLHWILTRLQLIG